MASIRQYDNNNIVITEGTVETMVPGGVVLQKRGTTLHFLDAQFRSVKDLEASEVTDVTDKDGTNTAITDIDVLFNTLRDTFFFRVTGGDGLGAIPFAIRSTDSLPAVFTSIALRDTYYTTNPGDIANTTDLGRGREAVGIGPTDGSTVGVTAAFIRNSANDAWIPIATNFIGPTGPASTVPGPTGPPGDVFPDVEITADLTINVANLSTYENVNIINARTVVGQVTVTLDTIANFLINDPNDEFIFRFINESAPSTMVITPGTGNFFAQIAGNVTLNEGQVLEIKLPQSGTRWNVLNESTTASAGVLPPPVTPTPLPAGNVAIVGTWDPADGSFPVSASQGDVYEITASGTFDNIQFFRGDFLISEVAGASTTTFAGNWGVIPGKGSVHSLFGRQGVLDDAFMIANLDRLGYVRNSGTVDPSFHEFSITTIANRVDLNTDLNGAQTIRFTVTNHGDVQSATVQADFVTIDDFQDVATIVNPTIDGVQTQSVTFSGITTDTQKTISFRIRAVDNQSNVHISNEYDVEVRTLTGNEFAYYGVRSANDFDTVDVATLTSVDVTSSGTQFSINEPNLNTQFLGILAPDNRDPISILDPLSQESLGDFTQTGAVRSINGQSYNLYVVQNNSGFDGTFAFTVTTE